MKVMLIQNVGSDAMNKKGFTLVELLSVLVLIGLLMGLAVPGISRITSNIKKKSQKTNIELIEKAAVLWGQDNRTLLYDKPREATIIIYQSNEKNNKIGYYTQVSIKDLIDDNYLDGESNQKKYEDPVSGEDLYRDDCKVFVFKYNNRVTAKFNISNAKKSEETSSCDIP